MDSNFYGIMRGAKTQIHAQEMQEKIMKRYQYIKAMPTYPDNKDVMQHISKLCQIKENRRRLDQS